MTNVHTWADNCSQGRPQSTEHIGEIPINNMLASPPNGIPRRIRHLPYAAIDCIYKNKSDPRQRAEVQSRGMGSMMLEETPNIHVLPQTPQLKAMLTMIRARDTSRADFVFYSDRIIRLLVEEALNFLPVKECTVETPLGVDFEGAAFEGRICGVSIMRAGESMEKALRDCCRYLLCIISSS